MRFLILCMLLISGASQSKEDPLGLNIQQGYFSKSCRQSIEMCFDSKFYSENDDDVIKAIILYLDNYNQMKEHYEYRLLLENMSKISKVGDNNLFLLEANIYFQGFHVPQSGSKAVNVLESNDLFNYEDPQHLVVLGNAYYIKYLENKKEIEEDLVKAKGYFLKAYNMGREHATRALALILVNSSNIEDVIMAGEVLRYFAESEIGTKLDRDKYNKYLDVMKEKVFGN